ncbi:MAG: ribbon-helix-helix protein, CopG family [Candidatus Rokubacteria bacterium]|nr:ribbon-helix-helix protein, CopG family [Candidatus Rokubacteria bacterium]MBI3105347.1 ribbon-helix-helix protein, CopG family [Candidatus Rokubacteria bacterium]
MARSRVAVTISIPPQLANEYDRLARATAKNRSQLFREMFALYRQSQDEEVFRALQRYGRRKARERGILTERDVERLVFEGR